MRKLKLLFAGFALLFGGISASAQDAGTYYIQNASNGKWLGPGNNWSTQASVLNHADYWKMAKISDGVYTLESVVSNGGQSYYLNGTYCDGSATNFTFAAVEGKDNTYTIANAGGGLLTTNGTTVDVSGSDATAAASQWKLWSETDMAAGMAAATVENPFDATYLIKDHDLGRNNRDYSAWSNTNATAPKSSTDAQGATVYSIEAYKKTFDVNQTLSGIPNGVYAVRVNGFYRQDGSDANLPYVYANDSKTTLPVRTGTENNMQDAAVSFVAGKYLSEPAYVQVTDGTLKVGVKTEGTSCWTIFKSFHLAYYGDCTVAEVLLADYVKAYNEALTEAQTFTEESMFADAWTALQSAVSSNTLNLSSVTQEQLETATANLKAANAAANAAVKAKTVYDSAVALINGGTNVDLTSIVTNASFEEGNLNGWTTVNGGAPANNNNWSKDGTWYVERWTANGDTQNHLSDGTLTHDALVLPAGLYTVTARAQNQEQKNGVAGTGYFLYANDEKVEITGTNEYSTSVLLSTDKSELVIKFALEGCTGNWISCDNIRLTYVGEDFPEYTLVTGKMNADVAAAQTAADETFQANKTVTNYNALTAAIAAAQASKDAYTAAATAIADANALKEAHNLASATAYNTFAEAIAALEAKYNANTMTTNEGNAAGTTLGTVVTGWRAGANGAAVKYMNDGFSLNDFDAALYINTWSNEGESDGSNFKVPFYEYFAGEGGALGENTWTGQVSGLENGLYSVSAWVRVRSKNAQTSAKDVYGISMDVNNGTAIDVTEGDTVAVNEGYGRFQHKVYTAEGLVKDGVLNVNFNIAADNNIHWLSFKNIKYTKVRDLTPEEEAIVPTAIALYNDETEVTEKIILNGSKTTVTLTTSLTPAEATPGYIEWESADESVATVVNGVIKANGTGTTTITAKSTLDPTITATATVVAYAFQNQSFEADGNQAAGNGTNPKIITITGWTQEQNSAGSYQDNQLRDATTDNNSNYGKRVTPSDGSYYFFYRHGWNGSNYAKLTSVAQNLPIGKYTLTVDYKMVAGSDNTSNNDNTAITLSAISGEKTLASITKNDATKANNNSSTAYLTNEAWKTVSTSFILEEATSVQAVINLMACGPKRSDFVVDNVTLTWSSFKGALKDAIDVAEAVDVTTNVGDAVFQIPASAVSTFTTAISDAQGVYDDAESTESNYLDAVKALDDAKTAYANAELNAPDAEQLYNIVVATADHAKENNPIIIIPGATSANNPSGYALNANFETNNNLSQAFTFTQVEGNTYKISAKVAGVDVYLTNGTLNESAAGWRNYQIQATTDAEKAMAFKVGVTDVDGAFVIYNTETNSTIACQTGGNIYTESGNANFKLVETSKPSITINTTAAGYGTTMLPFAVASLPQDVKAYTCAAVDGEILTLEEVNALEANKPYIIEGAWEEIVTGDAQGTALTYSEGLLTGVYAATAAPVGSYVMQKNNDKVGFYKVAEDKQPTVGANRCYLTVPAASAREAFFFGNETDGISAVEALTSGNAEIYNAAGARIPTLQKGMNIVKSNGKSYKVIVK